jgi:hypothetical protein
VSGNQSRQSPLHATPPSHLTTLYNNQPDDDNDKDDNDDQNKDDDKEKDDDKYNTHC